MSRKIDRARYGPSWVEVILGAVLSLVLGVILGALLLIFRPVKVVKEMPKEDAIEPKMVYFVEGSREGSRARNAAAKRAAFVAGQSVSVTEEELNTLAGPGSSFASTGAPGAAPKPSEASDEMLAAGTPNFRLRDGTVQIGVPVTVSLLGLSERIVVQARGGFVKQGNLFVYRPETLYLGSLPLQNLPFAAKYAREHFLNAQPIPDDIKESWGKLTAVTVEGNALQLRMP